MRSTLGPNARKLEATLARKSHNVESHREVLTGMQEIVADNLPILSDVDKAWQPTDYLPDLTHADWREPLEAFREAAEHVSDELLVVLVGDMVTEEALPNYAIALNYIAQDATGDGDSPWAKWLRGWTAEENRHGDLLNAYLRLTGRVDMRSVEVTIHHLINNGFNAHTFSDPYHGLIYTSFQERATRISHGNVATLARNQGDAALAQICNRIAGDEARHEQFYTRMMKHVIEVDPDGAMLAIRRMIRGLIRMPGKLMYDGKDPDLFDHFAAVAQRTGVYTVHDYADIIDHLIRTWDLASVSVTDSAAHAQDYLCTQAARYRESADKYERQIDEQPSRSFSWIHDRMA